MIFHIIYFTYLCFVLLLQFELLIHQLCIYHIMEIGEGIDKFVGYYRHLSSCQFSSCLLVHNHIFSLLGWAHNFLLGMQQLLSWLTKSLDAGDARRFLYWFSSIYFFASFIFSLVKTLFCSLHFGVTVNLVSTINSLTENANVANGVHYWHTSILHGL